ncbi:dihydrofolate reductase family protein [Sphingomonas sp.]|jgi:dihydrofolate reductase|uniref:dihydrofolate reductase family protein n=1 Tax=Sphingomonas sp. TaxID=28214 RepID=UPI002ED914F1
MRKIIGAAFVSIDGVMQAPGGPAEDWTGGFEHGGWLAPLFDEALGNQVDSFLKDPFDLLLGRKTWEIFAAHWPFTEDHDGIAASFAKNRKYVMTRSGMPLDWQGSERVPDFDALAAIKAGEGPNIVIQGSSTLYPGLLERGLIDRLVLMTAPVVLGRGKRLFGGGSPSGRWKLIEHRLSSTGIAMATYEPDGPVEVASFAMDDPHPRELARREKLEREG